MPLGSNTRLMPRISSICVSPRTSLRYAGRTALELILAIYKSQKTGMPVDLPLDEFSTEDMKGIFGEKTL